MNVHAAPDDQYAVIRSKMPALKNALEVGRNEFLLELLLGTELYRAVKRGELTLEEAMVK